MVVRSSSRSGGFNAPLSFKATRRGSFAMDIKRAEPQRLNTERYQSIDDTLPAMLPAITREEATRANRLLCKHFGKKCLGPVTMLNDVSAARTRACWLSPAPTRGSNHFKGWGRLIHDVSHRIFRRRHPSFRPHDGGHVTLEREIARYVVARGWLEGKLKPRIAHVKKLTADERRALLLQRTRASLDRWQMKCRRAENAIKKLKRKEAALVRRRVNERARVELGLSSAHRIGTTEQSSL
jgi:hypothetical protein